MSLCRLETILKKSPGLKLDAVSLVHSGNVCIYKPSTVVRLCSVQLKTGVVGGKK